MVVPENDHPAGWSAQTAKSATPLPGHTSKRYTLLIVGDDFFVREPLPEAGAVTIGRAPETDVRINDPSVSRQHAVIHLGDIITIEDLGSSNGTRVKGELLEPNRRVAIVPGDNLQIGNTSAVLQPGAAPVRFRRLCSHSYFEMRLEEEMQRLEATGGGCAVLRIATPANLPSDLAAELLGGEVRSTDTVASYGPADYEVLLVDTPPEQAASMAQRITAAFAKAGVTVRLGLANYRLDGRSAEALIARACELARGRETVVAPADSDIVVHDPAMQHMHKLVDRLAPGSISILLMGETGAGKEVLARHIHRRSKRAEKALLCLNCGAFSANLLESELFGHEKGAFTGAARSKQGLLEMAEGGTVFLDEIGELSVELQVKLLRVLEDRKVMRVGGLEARPIDVRFIAATNRNLGDEIAAGRFREDLYYRLAGATIVIPPLRERPSEIEPLARLFAKQACAREELPDAVLSEEALIYLGRYSWPGNIRELRNVMERAVLLAAGEVIDPVHLPLEKMTALQAMPAAPWASTGPQRPTPERAPTGETPHSRREPHTQELERPRNLATFGGEQTRPIDSELLAQALSPEEERRERQAITDALNEYAGNQTRTAKALGISRGTLIARMDRFNLPRPRKK